MAVNRRVNPNAPTRAATENLVQVLDTYVRPQRDTMGEQALAQGFNSMAQTFGNYSRRELSRELTETAQQAQTDALAGEDPNAEFAQVRMGNIFRPHSRAYMDAYNATQGRVAAIRFRDDTTLAYAESGLDQNTDPEAFRSWYNERLQGFLSQNENPYFLSGAMPLVEQATFNLSAQHTGNIVRTLRANRAAAARELAAEATMNTMGEWQRLEGQRLQFEASNPEYAADIEAQQAALIAHAVSGVNSDFYATGDYGAEFRGATLGGALDYAEATGNMGLVRSIGAAAHAGGLRLTPGELLDLTNRAQTIERDHVTQLRNQDFLMERERTESRRIVADFAADMAADPANWGMTPQQLLDSNPELQAHILGSDDTAGLMDALRTSWNAVTNVSEDITPTIAFENEVDFRAALNEGAITNPESALNWIRDQQAQGRVFTSANMNTFMQLATQAGAGNGNGILTNATFTAGVRNAGRQAVAQLAVDAPYDLAGNTTDSTALFLEGVVTAYMQDRAGTLDPNSQTYASDVRALQAEAVIAAHDQFRQINPEEYANLYDNALEENTVAMSPGFIQEFLRREEALQQAVAEEGASLEASVEAGTSLLFPEEVPGESSVPPTGGTTEEPQVTTEEPQATSSVPQEDMVMPFDEFEGMDVPTQPVTQDRQAEVDALLTTLAQYEDVIANGGSIYADDVIELVRGILDLPATMVSSEVRQRAAALNQSIQQ